MATEVDRGAVARSRATPAPGSGATSTAPDGSARSGDDLGAPPESFGARIRRLRRALGLTQQQLAEPRYSRAYLAALEAGVRIPTDEVLRHLAARLDTDPDDLRYGRPPGVAVALVGELNESRRALSRGRLDSAAATLLRVRDQAERYGLVELAGWVGYYTAEIQLHRGETTTAAHHYEQLATDLPDGATALRAAVVSRQAYCLLIGGAATRAVALLEGALRTLRDSPAADPDAELRLANALMYTFLELDWRDRARRLERQALPLLSRVDNQEWVAQFYAVAGQLRRSGDELDEVERYLTEAGRRYVELGLTRELALCHWARGYVLRRAGRPGEAVAELRRARDILGDVGAVQDQAGATLEMAEALRQVGSLDEAYELATVAAATSLANGHAEGMAEADRLLGRVAAVRGERDNAERLLRRAADRYEQADLMADVVSCCRQLGELLLEWGRLQDAREAFQRGLRAAERLR
ncbi:helix-turn-helix transcriptional regulator [Polymorphospora sp. NPDC050346]|uniref:helix-turn-helix transcriptional regulator n=1 Tax=Polymorphospora sp. NPDC050346 TaxID=3155780 RepID=UPI00340D2A94